MTKPEVLAFLTTHQPMPPTESLTESELQRFDEIRQWLQEHPIPEALPLLLNSFGEGDGGGVYQLVDQTVLAFPTDVVIPALSNALRSPHRSVRYWNAQLAGFFDHDSILDALTDLLKDDDLDVREATVESLFVTDSGILARSGARRIQTLRAHLPAERDNVLRDRIDEYIRNLEQMV